MALSIQNINHSAFRSMLEREKLFGTNFNDWFRHLRIAIQVEKKLNILDQPIPPDHVVGATNQELEDWKKIYDVHNEVACLMLGSMTLELQRQFEKFDLIQNFHACKQEQRKSVRSYVLKIKSYVEQLECLGYKPNKKPQAAKGKGKGRGKDMDKLVYKHRTKDDGISVSKNDVLYFNDILRNGIYEIDMLNLVPNVNSIYNVSNKRANHNLDSTYLWLCRLAYISKNCIEMLQHDGILQSMDDESFDQCVSCLSSKMTRKIFRYHRERATDLLGLIHTDVCGSLRHVSRQGASYFITFTDDYSHYGYVTLRKQWVTTSTFHLRTQLLLQDTSPSGNTNENLVEAEGFEPPQEDVATICRSLDAMNVEMQSMKDNQLWRLVNLLPDGKTVGSKWIFKKKTDMDGNAHTYKARLVVKDYTQTYEIDYEETFSPVTDIRPIRILIALAAFYDYEIWKVCKLQRSIYGLKQESKS
ncbi:retrotransposon protein, putative, ty1-copia subclass [Tanacetum coccineum]